MTEQQVYLILAVAGVTTVVIQVALQVFGLVGEEVGGGDVDFADADADLDADGDAQGDFGHGSWFAGLLTFKGLAAFAGVFGLTGLALIGDADVSSKTRVLTATLAGFAAMWVVAQMMRGLARLHHSGTMDLRRAVGQMGKVYLRVPASLKGEGKVTVEVEGRLMTMRAVTAEGELTVGTPVRVVEVMTDETLRVVEIPPPPQKPEAGEAGDEAAADDDIDVADEGAPEGADREEEEEDD